MIADKVKKICIKNNNVGTNNATRISDEIFNYYKKTNKLFRIKNISENLLDDCKYVEEDFSVTPFFSMQKRDRAIMKLINQVNSFSHLKNGWDTYEGEPPSKKAIDLALSLCRLLDEKPSSITPMCDGGVCFRFNKDYCRIIVDIYNNGIIVFLKRNVGEMPKTKKISIDEVNLYLKK